MAFGLATVGRVFEIAVAAGPWTQPTLMSRKCWQLDLKHFRHSNHLVPVELLIATTVSEGERQGC